MPAEKESPKKATRIRRPLEERLKEAQEKPRKLRARSRKRGQSNPVRLCRNFQDRRLKSPNQPSTN